MFNFKESFRDYNVSTIKNELLAGMTTSLALMPECIAFAIVANLTPLVGLYTAAIICLITAFLGGRPGMVSGAAGSIAVVSVALVVSHGVEYLFLAVLLMGIIQILVGVFKLAKFIRLVPQPVIYGFLNGLAIIIFLSQFEQFKTASGAWLTGTPLILMVVLVAISAGTMYGTLSKMEKDSLIRFYSEEDNRKLYQITGLGCEILDKEITRIERLYKNSKGEYLNG